MHRSVLTPLFIVIAAVSVPNANADRIVWSAGINSTGDWTTASNWGNATLGGGNPASIPAVPGIGDAAEIGFNATATIQSIDNITIDSLILGINPGYGYGGNGSLILDGTLNVTSVNLGNNGGRSGTIFLNSGGALNVTNDITVSGGDTNGNNAGFLNVDGGTLAVGGDITANSFRLGDAVGTSGSYTMAAGQTLTNSGTLIVGNNGSGNLTLADPTSVAVVGSGLYVGNSSTSTGNIVAVDSGYIDINNNGLFVGRILGSDATMTLGTNGGNLNDARIDIRGSNFEVGSGGEGTFTQESGTVDLQTNNLVIGQSAGSVGSYTINGGALNIQAAGDINMNLGRATLTINGGSVSARAINPTYGTEPSTINLNAGSLTLGANIVDRAAESIFTYNGTQVSLNGGSGFMTGDVLNIGTSANTTLNLTTSTAATSGDFSASSITVRDLALSSAGFTGGVIVGSGTTLGITGLLSDGNADATGSNLTISNGGLMRTQGSTLGAFGQISGFTMDAGSIYQVAPNAGGAPTVLATTASVNGTIDLDDAFLSGAPDTSPATASTWVNGTGTWDATNVPWDNGNPAGFSIATSETFSLIQGNVTDSGIVLDATDAGNGWQLNVTPGSTGSVVLERTGAAIASGPFRAVLNTSANAGSPLTITRPTDLNIGVDTGADASLLQIESDVTLQLTSGSNLTIGGTNAATGASVSQNGGSVLITGDLRFGSAAGDVGGTYTVNGTLEVTGQILEVDPTVSNAQLYINNGTLVNTNDITVQSFRVAEGNNTTASFTLAPNQDLENTGTLYVATNGTGTLTLDDATASVSSASIVIGNGGNAMGTFNMSAGTLSTTGTNITVGNSGTGELNITDGTVTIANGLINANGSTGNGTINIGSLGSPTGPTITITTGNIETANNGVGVINFYSGSLQQDNANLIVGQGSGSNATFNMEGGTMTLFNQLRIANRDNTGEFNLNGGIVNVGTILDIGNTGGLTAAGTGTLNMNDGELNVGSRTAGALKVGNANSTFATSVANLLGGTTTVSGGIYVAALGADSSGTLNIGDGTSTPTVINTGSNVEVGSQGTGITTLKSGNLYQESANLVIGQATTGNGTVNVEGGKWWLGFNGSTQASNNVSDLNFNNGISELNVSGGEMQVARHVNLHSNADPSQMTTVNLTGGSFLVGGNVVTRAGTTTFNIGGDATVNVTGNFNFNLGAGSLNVDGGAADIHIGGNFLLNGGRELQFTPALSTGFSTIVADGTVTLGGTGLFDWTNLTSAFIFGDVMLIDQTTSSNPAASPFSNWAEGDIVNTFGINDAYKISYLGFDGLGNDVVLLAVPEPSRGTLALFAFSSLLFVRRRR